MGIGGLKATPDRCACAVGDLWSGNIAAVDGQPCIFDPATYYGHHEAEWGMRCGTRGSSACWAAWCFQERGKALQKPPQLLAA